MKTSAIIIKRPSDFFKEIMHVASCFAKAVGCDITDPNYRIGWLTLVSILSIVIYFIFTTTTIVKMFDENRTFMLEAFCMAGSVVQGCAKISSVLVYKLKFRATRYMVQNLYKDYEQRGPKYCDALNKCCAQVRKVLIVIGVSYILLATAMVCSPLIMMGVSEKLYLVMHFHIPGVDVDTPMGYFITFCAHFMCMYVGALGLFAGDVYVLIYLTQTFLFVDIFKLKIQELNDLVANFENNQTAHANEILIDIVEWHQFYLKYTKDINNYLYYIVTVQVTSAALSILLTLYVLVTAEWPGALPFLVSTVYCLYVYCILGTKIEICNDEFCNDIYSITWYNLTVAQQKIVRVMLMQSQTPNTINIAGVMPLSVSTALQITKTIYSIFMMMLQFLN